MPIQNYLRAKRKGAALSQEECADLLDCSSGAKVCHFESFKRPPTLEMALIYEILFDVPVAQLFAGVYEHVKVKTIRRIHALLEQLSNVPLTPQTQRKLEFLNTTLERLTNNDNRL